MDDDARGGFGPEWAHLEASSKGDDGPSLEDSLRCALEGVFGIDASAKRDEARVLLREEQALDDLRVASLRRVRSGYDVRRKDIENSIVGALCGYMHECAASALEVERKRAGLLFSLQREKRYEAFLRMKSSDLLLKRVGQSIDAAAVKIESDSPGRIASCYGAAANRFRADAEKACGIEVSAPQESDQGAGFGDSSVFDGLLSEPDAAVQSGAMGAVDALFAEALGARMERVEDVLSREGKRRKLRDELGDLEERAAVAVVEIERDAARRAQGCHLPAFDLPVFGGVKCARVLDAAALRVLVAEVRASYATYARCVSQGGLFCAFGIDFGNTIEPDGMQENSRDLDECLDPEDEEMPGDGRACCSQVPEPTDADVAHVVAHMREFNEKPFRGILDDDPAEFAEQFWYGFKKLLLFADFAVSVDAKGWDAFVAQAKLAACEAGVTLACSMSLEQAEDFSCKLDDLGKVVAGKGEENGPN